VITPSTPPVVNQSGTYKFTANVPVNWSIAPGSKGSIDPDGTYHAPAVVTAQQSVGGCQLLPNDHIINTRIDSLPVNSNNSTWISSANYGALQYNIMIPLNYADGSTPTQNMVFQYAAGNNGPFTFPIYPNGNIQAGWLSDYFNYDHHEFTINPTTCYITEINAYYPIGANSSAPTTNSIAGVQYQNSSYALNTNGTTDAAGMTLLPMMIHYQEWQNAVNTGGTINHAVRITFRGAAIKNLSYLWPATEPDYTGFGAVPFGARVRLKSSYNISSFSPQAQVLLRQLQQYGAILDDTGSDWNVHIDFTKLPYAYTHAITELANANITPSYFEFVDESSLEVSATSGATTSSETVVATASGGTAKQQVVLTGVTIGVPKDQLYIQAGTGAQQLTAFVNATSNNNVTWTMSPSVGTLTSGGLYTPPSTVAINTATTITVTSNADSNVTARINLVVLVPGIIRIIMGGPCAAGLTYTSAVSSFTCTTTPYVDSHDNSWQAQTGDSGGNENNCGGGIPPWPNFTDIGLYEIPYSTGSANDMRFDLTVPNGNYSVKAKFANGCSYDSAIGSTGVSLESQGTVYYPNVDIIAASGGEYQPVDFTVPAAVTNGQLSFVLRFIKGPVGTTISALEIDPVAGSSNSGSVQLAPPASVTAIVQ
jgi:hypothetical protein